MVRVHPRGLLADRASQELTERLARARATTSDASSWGDVLPVAQASGRSSPRGPAPPLPWPARAAAGQRLGAPGPAVRQDRPAAPGTVGDRAGRAGASRRVQRLRRRISRSPRTRCGHAQAQAREDDGQDLTEATRALVGGGNRAGGGSIDGGNSGRGRSWIPVQPADRRGRLANSAGTTIVFVSSPVARCSAARRCDR